MSQRLRATPWFRSEDYENLARSKRRHRYGYFYVDDIRMADYAIPDLLLPYYKLDLMYNKTYDLIKENLAVVTLTKEQALHLISIIVVRTK